MIRWTMSAPSRLGWLAVLAWAAASCGLLNAPQSDEDAVMALVRANFDALQRENLPDYMSTVDDRAPHRDETEGLMRGLFRDFDLAYELLEIELVSITNVTARVRTVQTARWIAGDGPFRNNRLTAVHILRKNLEDEWRIFQTELELLELLDFETSGTREP